MAKHDKSGKKKGKGKKARRSEAAATEATAVRAEPSRAGTGSSLPRMAPPAMLLAVGAIIAGGATALLRLRR